MEQHKNGQAAPQPDSHIEQITSPEQGRLPQEAPQAPAQETDISQIDQQEGQMNNGELGGNFNAPDNTQ